MAYDSSFLQSSFQRHVGTPTASHEQMVTSSPSSPSTAAAATGASSPFLPGYLLGDTPVAAPAATPGTGVRPGWSLGTPGAGGHGRLHGHYSSPLAVGSGAGSAGSLLPGSGGSSSLASMQQSQLLHTAPGAEGRGRDSAHGIRGKDKPAPPPVHGLFDVMASSGAFPTAPSAHTDLPHSERLPLHMSNSLNRTPLPDGRTHVSHVCYSSPAVGGGHVPQQTPGGGFAKTQPQPLSPAQVDPFYTQGEALTPADILDERWVTVFGFQPAAAAFVLRQFSQYGTILEHVMCGDGNWMHLHYQTKIQARKALSKNGKIIGNNIMVGVTPCIDKDVMARSDENLDLSLSASSNLSRLDGSRLGARGGTSSLRPLTAAYKSAASLSEVTPRTQTPKKSTGLLSKAMEYMFGW